MSNPFEFNHTPEPIAIIGIGCRYPGAESPSAFWELVANGVDAITEIPAERWDIEAFYDADAQAVGKMNTRWGGFLKQVDRFEPQFFKIPAREAAHIDPQQRLLLEVAWEALEDAGQVAEKLAGSRTGVFVGVMSNDYGDMAMTNPANMSFYSIPGLSYCITANRLSYFFDFRGPSMAIDTACSSSLVAVHLACRSLWSGETTLALAGGVNVILSAEGTIWYTKAGLMAADGRCKTFDARADGLVRGEGAGIVVLKPLSKAQADGDPVYAVIKGSAVNQDGRSNGLTAPNRWAQEAVIREAYRQAGVAPAAVDYVELHGTGTSLGDPIEAMALGHVLADGRADENFCAVGSVKTNIGHLEAAAGVAGLTKVALMLKHRMLAPSLHFEKPNPHIPYATLPLRVQQTLAPWPAAAKAAIAAVSSFGFGGTNAHIVLGEASGAHMTATDGDQRGAADKHDDDAGARGDGACLLTISAHTGAALQANARAYRRFLANEGAATSLTDICYTANARRTQHDYRLALVGSSHAELAEVLDKFLSGEAHPACAANQVEQGRRPKTAFVFSGQGPQWWAMGRQLMKDERVFRTALEECDAHFGAQAGWSLLEQLQADEVQTRMTETSVAQPSLFALQVGLARLWRSWGIEPDGVVGHSMGEVAAAHVAGALSLDVAVRVIFHRSRLMQRLTGHGKMAVVAVGWAEAAQLLVGFEDRLALAAHNSPGSCVLSGESAALAEVLAPLKQSGVHWQLLPVNYAFHSPQLRALEQELVESLAGIETQPPTLPVFPTLGGESHDGRMFDAAYWGRQMREPVLFAEAVGGLLAGGFQTFVEVGPHPVLGGAMTECFRASGRAGVALASLRRGDDERGAMLKTLGALHTRGQRVDWNGLNKSKGRCVSLPSYQWQRQRFWLKEQEERYSHVSRAADAVAAQPAATCHPLLGRCMSSATQAQTYHWETTLDCNHPPYLKDHRVRGALVVPAATSVAMAHAAATELFGQESVELENIHFERALTLEEDRARKIQLVVLREDESTAAFRLFSLTDVAGQPGDWTLHARGSIRRARTDASAPRSISIEEVKGRCAESIDGAEFYRLLARRGLEYGATLQGIERVRRRDGEALASLRSAHRIAPVSAASQLSPVLLDICFQVLAGALPAMSGGASSEGTFLPVGFKELRVRRQPSGEGAMGYAVLHPPANGSGSLEGDVLLLDESGAVLVEVRGLRLLRVRDERRGIERDSSTGLYEVEWRREETLEDELAAGTGRNGATGRWLILVDDHGVGRSVVAGLEAAGESTVVVRRSDEYRRTAENEFYVDPANPAHFRQLLADAFGSDLCDCRGVMHLWSLDAAPPHETTRASLGRAQVLGCDSVLHLVQALEGGNLARSSRVWLVTAGAQPVGGTDGRIALAQTPVWGLGRVIAEEYPARRCTLVDLSFDDAARCVDALLREMRSSSGEEQIALRGGVRYVARLKRREDGAARGPESSGGAQPETEDAQAALMCADQTYLISGGLGALGLRIAQWMVGQGARHLVLVGRSVISKIAREAVAAMRETGTTVTVATTDISDAEQVGALLQEIRDTMPPLKGVVHAAGVVDDALLRNLDSDRFTRVVAPKIFGAWNLHRHTLETKLDFFVLFSSFSALVGNAGQASYAAGNAFLDGLAHYRRAHGLPSLSINWGPWAQAGMAAGREAGFELQGIKSITPEEGTEIFGRLLQQDAAQVGVLAADWSKFIAQSHNVGMHNLLTDFAGASLTMPVAKAATAASAKPELVVRLDSALPANRRDILVTHLQEEVRRVMGLPVAHRPGLQQGFFDMGMDSLMIAELGRNLQENVGRNLPLSVIIDRANIEGLADYLSGDLFALEPATEAAPTWERAGEIGSALERLELLSEDEALSRLLQKLQ